MENNMSVECMQPLQISSFIQYYIYEDKICTA